MESFVVDVLKWLSSIMASLIVVFFTQVINEKYFVPKRKMRKLIEKVDFILDYYANILSNPGVSKQENEASEEIRKIAMKCIAFSINHPKTRYKRINTLKLCSIGNELTAMSNSVGDKYLEYNVHKKIEELKQRLHSTKS